MVDMTPYSTAAPYISTVPAYAGEEDAERVASYTLYDAMYWNVHETFKLVARGAETHPIYLPTPRIIVDTTDRFTARSMFYAVVDSENDNAAVLLRSNLDALFRRERFWGKYGANKLDGIRRGDWAWHVVGNTLKPAGTRVSIYAIDPASVFKLSHPDDPDRTIGVDVVDLFTAGGETRLRRQRYTRGNWAKPEDFPKLEEAGATSEIWSSLTVWKVDEWRDVTKAPVQTLIPPTALPPQITSIPVYTVPHQEQTGGVWGSSELRGYERLFAALNQAVSDEELALALDGLGLYATDSGAPVDPATGAPTNWRLGPGKVVELSGGSTFSRVNGVTSLPAIDHMNFILSQIAAAGGLSDVASGRVDVSVAESGIALMLQLQPILAKVERYDATVADIHRQMFYDLRAWLEAYEGMPLTRSLAVAEPMFADKLPLDRDKRFKEILELFAAGIVDLAWVHNELTSLGFDMTGVDLNAVLEETAARAAANDPFAARAAAEEPGENVVVTT